MSTGAEYTDDTVMFFGKFKGTALANVPAWWLIWYEEQPGIKDGKLLAYIKANKMILLQEQDLADIKKNKGLR